MSSGKYGPIRYDMAWDKCPIQIDNCPRCGKQLKETRVNAQFETDLNIIQKVCSVNTGWFHLEKATHFIISYEIRYGTKICYLVFKEHNTPLQNYIWRYEYIETLVKDRTMTMSGRPFKQLLGERNHRVEFWWQPKDQTLYARPEEFYNRIEALKNFE